MAAVEMLGSKEVGKLDEKTSILIVDDDVSMCETLSDALEEKRYRVVIAEDGPKAIEEVRSQRFDLVLVDIAMPDMNGVETLRRIRAIDPQITAMIMTGYKGLDAFVPEDLEAKVEGTLYKPLDIDVIVEMLECKAKAPGPPRSDPKGRRAVAVRGQARGPASTYEGVPRL
jgi:CheY-like chemotaxis protein